MAGRQAVLTSRGLLDEGGDAAEWPRPLNASPTAARGRKLPGASGHALRSSSRHGTAATRADAGFVNASVLQHDRAPWEVALAQSSSAPALGSARQAIASVGAAATKRGLPAGASHGELLSAAAARLAALPAAPSRQQSKRSLSPLHTGGKGGVGGDADGATGTATSPSGAGGFVHPHSLALDAGSSDEDEEAAGAAVTTAAGARTTAAAMQAALGSSAARKGGFGLRLQSRRGFDEGAGDAGEAGATLPVALTARQRDLLNKNAHLGRHIDSALAGVGVLRSLQAVKEGRSGAGPADMRDLWAHGEEEADGYGAGGAGGEEQLGGGGGGTDIGVGDHRDLLEHLIAAEVASSVGPVAASTELGMSPTGRRLLEQLQSIGRAAQEDGSASSPLGRETGAVAAALMRQGAAAGGRAGGHAATAPGGRSLAAEFADGSLLALQHPETRGDGVTSLGSSLVRTQAGGLSPRSRGVAVTAHQVERAALAPRDRAGAPRSRAAIAQALQTARGVAGLSARLESAGSMGSGGLSGRRSGSRSGSRLGSRGRVLTAQQRDRERSASRGTDGRVGSAHHTHMRGHSADTLLRHDSHDSEQGEHQGDGRNADHSSAVDEDAFGASGALRPGSSSSSGLHGERGPPSRGRPRLNPILRLNAAPASNPGSAPSSRGSSRGGVANGSLPQATSAQQQQQSVGPGTTLARRITEVEEGQEGEEESVRRQGPSGAVDVEAATPRTPERGHGASRPLRHPTVLTETGTGMAFCTPANPLASSRLSAATMSLSELRASPAQGRGSAARVAYHDSPASAVQRGTPAGAGPGHAGRDATAGGQTLLSWFAAAGERQTHAAAAAASTPAPPVRGQLPAWIFADGAGTDSRRMVPVVHLVPQGQSVQALRHGDPSAKRMLLQEWLLGYEEEVKAAAAAARAARNGGNAATGSAARRGGVKGPASSAAAGSSLQSDILDGELRLRRVRVFSSPFGRPADLSTAAAFALLDTLLSSMGRCPPGSVPREYAGRLREVQAVLLQAIYAQLALPAVAEDAAALLTSAAHVSEEAGWEAEAAAGGGGGGGLPSAVEEVQGAGISLLNMPPAGHVAVAAAAAGSIAGPAGGSGVAASASSSALGLTTLSFPGLPVRSVAAEASGSSTGSRVANLIRYYSLSSYATLATALAAERDMLAAALKELASTLESWEKGRDAEIRTLELRTRVARKWQLVAFRELRRKQASAQAEAIEMQRQQIVALELQLRPSADSVLNTFRRIPTDAERTAALLTCLGIAASSWAPVLRFLCSHVPLDVMLRLVSDCVAERPELSLDDLCGFVAALLKHGRIKGAVMTVSAADGAAVQEEPAEAFAAAAGAGGAESPVPSQRSATSGPTGGDGTEGDSLQAAMARQAARQARLTRLHTVSGTAAPGSAGGSLAIEVRAGDMGGVDAEQAEITGAELAGGEEEELAAVERPPPSMRVGGQAYVLNGAIAALKGLDTTGALPALVAALVGPPGTATGGAGGAGSAASTDALSVLRFLLGLDRWLLPARDLRKHLAQDDPAAVAIARAAAEAAGLPASMALQPANGVRRPMDAEAFRPLLGCLTRTEKHRLLRELLSSAGLAGWHAFTESLFAGSTAEGAGAEGEGAIGAGAPATALADAIRHADPASRSAVLALLAEGLPLEVLEQALNAQVTLLGRGGRARLGTGASSPSPKHAVDAGATPAVVSPAAAAGAPQPQRPRRVIMAARSPLFSRYVEGRLPRGAKPVPKFKLGEALGLVYEAYSRKVTEDGLEDVGRAGGGLSAEGAGGSGAGASGGRSSIADFLRYFLILRFGLPTTADAHGFALAEGVRRLAPRSVRLRMFGQMTGLLEPDAYSPRMGTVFLQLLRTVYPDFNPSVLRLRREGRAFIPLDRALAAINVAFVTYNIGLSKHKLMLTGARKETLVRAVQAAADTYAAAYARAVATEQAALASGGAATSRSEALPGSMFARPAGGSTGGGAATTRKGPAGGIVVEDPFGGVAASLSSPTGAGVLYSGEDASRMTAEARIEVRGSAAELACRLDLDCAGAGLVGLIRQPWTQHLCFLLCPHPGAGNAQPPTLIPRCSSLLSRHLYNKVTLARNRS